jgi:hypothetical protein
MDIPSSKHHSNNQGQLVGVPKRKAPDLWWRIVFWPDAIGKQWVPDHLRSTGMYCPNCRKGQTFGDHCSFCGCNFSCFVVIKTNSDTKTVSTQNKSGRLNAAPKRLHYRLLPWLGKSSPQLRAMIAGVAVLLLASLVVGTVQYRNSKRKQYVHNYVLALYGIKSGMNLGEKVCDGTYNAWRGVESASSTMHHQALADLELVKAENARIMKMVSSPPKEYNQVARILYKLHENYEKTNSMLINSQDNPSRLKPVFVATEKEFSQGILDLKASMPAPLLEEIKKANQKYKMKFME